MAGCFAAVKAREQGLNVLLVDKGYVSRSGETPYAGDTAVFDPEWGHDLSRWQEQASQRSSNPFLYVSRHTEFLIKRCCMPWLVLAFALFGATYMAFIGAAVGANIAWPIVLYSYFTFNPAQTSND